MEYDNTIADLLSDTSKPSSAFPQEGKLFGFDNIAEAQVVTSELAGMAFACDLTRVTTLLLQGSGGNIKLPGMSRGVHDASHDLFLYPKDSNTPAGDADRNKNTKWFAEYFAGFLARRSITPQLS